MSDRVIHSPAPSAARGRGAPREPGCDGVAIVTRLSLENVLHKMRSPPPTRYCQRAPLPTQGHSLARLCSVFGAIAIYTVRMSERARGRAQVLLIHQDSMVLDTLTRMFEHRGVLVLTAASAFRAQSILAAEREVSAIVAQWDASHPIGAEIYRWAISHRYDLRSQFIFLAEEIADDFDSLVAGRCLVVAPTQLIEISRVVEAAISRQHRLAEAGAPEQLSLDQPRLLLAEDEPMLMLVMSRLLSTAGYDVHQADSGNRAISALERDDFDVIVVDWRMDDGGGAEVFKFLCLQRPWLVDRLVFLSGGATAEVEQVAPSRPIIAKGQDSALLLRVLQDIVNSHRHAP
jgi:DNA-binding response OmpR family regulator